MKFVSNGPCLSEQWTTVLSPCPKRPSWRLCRRRVRNSTGRVPAASAFRSDGKVDSCCESKRPTVQLTCGCDAGRCAGWRKNFSDLPTPFRLREAPWNVCRPRFVSTSTSASWKKARRHESRGRSWKLPWKVSCVEVCRRHPTPARASRKSTGSGTACWNGWLFIVRDVRDALDERAGW